MKSTKPAALSAINLIVDNNAPHISNTIAESLSSRINWLTNDLSKYINFERLSEKLTHQNILDHLCAGGSVEIYVDGYLQWLEEVFIWLNWTQDRDPSDRRKEKADRGTTVDNYETRKKYYLAFRIIIVDWLAKQGLTVLPLKMEVLPWHELDIKKNNYQDNLN